MLLLGSPGGRAEPSPWVTNRPSQRCGAVRCGRAQERASPRAPLALRSRCSAEGQMGANTAGLSTPASAQRARPGQRWQAEAGAHIAAVLHGESSAPHSRVPRVLRWRQLQSSVLYVKYPRLPPQRFLVVFLLLLPGCNCFVTKISAYLQRKERSVV